jgi:cell division protein ZapA (FtsZ GTPase activity inhibitor)
MIKAPVIQPIHFVVEAVSAWEVKLTSSQIANLTLLLSSLILLGTLSFTGIAIGWLCTFTVNRLHHFFKFSNLSIAAIMAAAIQWALSFTSMNHVSCRLVIDDTMKHHSKGCRTISGVYWLFDHVIGACTNAKCIVFAYVIFNECVRFPIGWRVYKKGGKKKWQMAIELIDGAMASGMQIHIVLFDSWYCVSGMLHALIKRNLKFIGDLTPDHNVEFRDPDGKPLTISVGQTFTYCKHMAKANALGLVSEGNGKPDRTLYKTWCMNLFLPSFGYHLRCIKSVDQRTNGQKILVTNSLSWEASKILTEYSFRWMIEEFFKNAKGLYGFEKAYMRSEQAGALALLLVSLVDLLLSVQIWKSVHVNSKEQLLTVSAIIAAAELENLQNFITFLERDEIAFKEMLGKWAEILERDRKRKRRIRKILVPADTCLNDISMEISAESMIRSQAA